MRRSMLVRVMVVVAVIFAIQGIQGAEKDESLLFAVDFDDYSVNAGFAKGDPKCHSFKNPDLQLRMFPGVNGKGNAVTLTNEECCEYKLAGNFDPRKGTVSVWVSPQNWKMSSNKWQQFFSVSTPKFNMILYKYLWPKCNMFYIKFPGALGKKKVFTALVMLEDRDWKAGKWHKFDITWDEKGMKFYVDGVMPKVYHNDGQLRIPFYKFQTPMSFPAPDELKKKSVITFGLRESARKNKGTDLNYQTAYDDIKIYNRPLSALEIRAAYEKYFLSKLESERKLPVVTIPKTSKGVVIDGKIDKAEWSDAGLVPVACFLGDPIPGV